MKLPHVIGDPTHRLAHVLDSLLAEHKGESLDLAALRAARMVELVDTGLKIWSGRKWNFVVKTGS